MIQRSFKPAQFAAVFITSGIFMMYYFGIAISHKDGVPRPDIQGHKKTLIIMTQTRSGSSFAGEIFAAANSSMYLYEPLYPYGLQCKFPTDRKTLLKRLLGCNFSNLNKIYSQGFNKSKWAGNAGCLHDGFCFTKKSTGLLNSYREACKKSQSASVKCGFPLRSEIMKNVCESSDLLVTKVTRVCTLEEMDDIYRHLKRGKRDVYVVHLVRDLRSIASSKIKLSTKTLPLPNLKGIIQDVKSSRCRRQRQNLVDEATAAKEFAMIADGHFMRIRYEDLSTNTVQEAKRIFKFMKQRLPPEVVDNIMNYLHPKKSVLQKIEARNGKGGKIRELSKQYESLYGVVRDPTKILNEWRNLVPFDAVQVIQESCNDVMQKMGYAAFSSEEELKDLTLPSFFPRSGLTI